MNLMITDKSGIRHFVHGELSRQHNFAALRATLRRPDNRLTTETEMVGQNYVRVEAQKGFGAGFLEFIQFSDDFITVVSDLAFNHDAGCNFTGENWIRFKFKLDGMTTMLFDDHVRRDMQGRSAHILLHPEGMKHSDHYYAGTRNRWVSVLCKRDRLTNNLGIDPERLPAPLRRFLAYGEPSFYSEGLRPSEQTLKVVRDMFTGPRTEMLRALYLKAKSYEAMLGMFEDLLDGAEAIRPTLTAKDIDRLHEARALIDADGMRTLNLNTLARSVGLNRNKLSYGFKGLFGLTISDYCLQGRLEEARRLLLETDLSVSMIALEVGYGHVSNFSAAFSRYHGLSPLDIRRGCRPVGGGPKASLKLR